MKKGIVLKITSAIVCFILLLSIGGVIATWTYSNSFIDDVDELVNVTINEFEYAPEVILPGDEEADKLGQNHLTLIDRIVNHITYGLNADSKPIVNDLLQSGTPVVYSQQNVQGGNLKHLLLTGATVDKLDFAVEYVTATEYACYTMATASLTSSNLGRIIAVYKTKIIYEEGKWKATVSYEGQATVVEVKVKNHNIITIDVESWTKT